jgi:uncharacterized protein YuzE
MKLKIDQAADALYLKLDDVPVTDSEEVSTGVIVDYDAAGNVVGIEMLYLSSRAPGLNPQRLEFEMVGAESPRPAAAD